MLLKHLMKSAPATFVGRTNGCSVRLSRPHALKPNCGESPAIGRSHWSARRSVCRFPSSNQHQHGMAHHTSARARPQTLRSDVLAHAEELLTGRHGEVPSLWRWAPWTVTMPPHGLGITLGRLGSQGWLSVGAGTWAVPSQRRPVDGEAFRQGSSIGRTRDRYKGQQTALRVHFPWTESELRQYTARFESVSCCVPGRGPCRTLFDGQAAVGSI